MNSGQLFLTISKGKASWRRRGSSTRFIVAIFMLVLFIAIGIAEYYGFIRFFDALQPLESIRSVVVAYTLQSIFLLLFILVLASTLITGPFILLSKKDINFLLPLPIKKQTLFQAHFIQEILTSLWIALLFGIPAILALAIYYHSWLILVDGVVFFIVLMALAMILGNILLLIIMFLTRRWSIKVNFVIIAILVGLLLLVILKVVVPKEIFQILMSDNPNGNQAAMNNLASQYNFWPSGWYVNTLINDLNFISISSLPRIFLVVITSLFLALQALLASYFYRPILQSSQENLERIAVKSQQLIRYQGTRLLIVKEWVALERDRRDLGQFVLILFLLGMYLSFIFSSKTVNIETDPVWTPRITMFIVLILIYFITILGMRFVYPLTSLERSKSWFFYTLPLVRLKNFSARIYAWSLPAIMIIETMILLTASAFSLNTNFTYPLMLAIPFITIFIMTLSNSFGTFFPVSEKNEPEALSTTPSGLALFVLISIYALIVVYGLSAETVSALSLGTVGIEMGSIYWLIVTGSIGLSLVLWYFGARRYRQMYLD